MIITRLIGGLGNQLFQYALGRRIAHDKRVPLKLDISGFESYKLHDYSLQQFSIRQDFATPGEIAATKKQRLDRIQNRLPLRWRSNIVERHFHFDPEVLEVFWSHAYFDGYWQSEKYFESIRPILKTELTIAAEPDVANQRMADNILTKNAVSIHIRRGDYVTNEKAFDCHGVTPLPYYADAVKLVAAEVSDPHFFVFSDDPGWAQQNLSMSYPCTIVSHNGVDRNFEDLRLMSLCEHHIIANSTFGWWGAWLSENDCKIVVAPKKWFNDPGITTHDLIPTGWRRI